MEINTKNLKIVSLELSDLEVLVKKPKVYATDINILEVIRRVKNNSKQLFYNTLNEIYFQGKSIGYVYFSGLDDGYLEVKYEIIEDKRDNGYATEALGGVINMAFEDPHVDVICAYINEINPAAVRVLAKNKFHFIKETLDGNYYELLK